MDRLCHLSCWKVQPNCLLLQSSLSLLVSVLLLQTLFCSSLFWRWSERKYTWNVSWRHRVFTLPTCSDNCKYSYLQHCAAAGFGHARNKTWEVATMNIYSYITESKSRTHNSCSPPAKCWLHITVCGLGLKSFLAMAFNQSVRLGSFTGIL